MGQLLVWAKLLHDLQAVPSSARASAVQSLLRAAKPCLLPVNSQSAYEDTQCVLQDMLLCVR